MSARAVTHEQAETFSRCMSVAGVAVFPSDTVYGLACDPSTRRAVERLYALKGRPPDKPAAVMFFSLELALAALSEQGERTRAAMALLLPGPVTLLLPNPAERYPLACVGDPMSLGLRVPRLPEQLGALEAVRWPILQTSANVSGGHDARLLADVPRPIRHGADLVIDGGELPGTASTVVDLRRLDAGGEWAIVREGAMAGDDVAARLTELA